MRRRERLGKEERWDTWEVSIPHLLGCNIKQTRQFRNLSVRYTAALATWLVLGVGLVPACRDEPLPVDVVKVDSQQPGAPRDLEKESVAAMAISDFLSGQSHRIRLAAVPAYVIAGDKSFSDADVVATVNALNAGGDDCCVAEAATATQQTQPLVLSRFGYDATTHTYRIGIDFGSALVRYEISWNSADRWNATIVRSATVFRKLE